MRNPAMAGGAREPWRGITSVACLLFVALLAAGFWVGALWLGQSLMFMANLPN